MQSQAATYKPVDLAKYYTEAKQGIDNGGGSNFVKLEEGDNVLRFLVGADGIPYVLFSQHQGVNEKGTYATFLDMDACLRNNRLATQIQGQLSEEDLDLYAEHGDPANRLYKFLADKWGFKTKEWPDGFKPTRQQKAPTNQQKAAFVVFFAGEVGLLEVTKRTFDRIKKQEERMQERFYAADETGFPIIINRDDSGSFTEYTVTVDPMTDRTAVDLPDSIPSVYDVFKGKVPSFEAKTKFVERSYRPHLDAAIELGFTPIIQTG